MTTHETLEQARDAAASVAAAAAIIEIDHATQGRCYIVAKCGADALGKALVARPMPAILSVIGDHDILTDADRAARTAEWLRTETRCGRCKEQIDGNTAYQQDERARFGGRVVIVTAHYCESCRSLLQSIGAGEYTDMQARASEQPSMEISHKADH